jgi:hypothetical protein
MFTVSDTGLQNQIVNVGQWTDISELTGGSVMHHRGCDPGFVVHYTTLCCMYIQRPSFVSVRVQMESLTGCPKCAGIKYIMTICLQKCNHLPYAMTAFIPP